MKPAAPLALVLLAACSAAPPTPPTVTLPVATSEPPPPAPTAVAVPEPPPFQPAPPFAVVVRAGAADDVLAAFPLEGGAAAVIAGRSADLQHTLRIALLDHDEITAAPELAAGLPPTLFCDGEMPLVAGRWPDDLWLTRGAASCEAYRWSPEARTWEARPAKTPPAGRCARLAAWTPGAALAVVEGQGGPSLVAFGAAPKVVPALPPRRRDQPKECAGLAAHVHHLFAFRTGEVIAVGPACRAQDTWLARWASGKAKGDVLGAEVDPNTPYLAAALSKDEVVVDGAGVLPGSQEEVALRATFRVEGGRMKRASIAAHEVNAQERWTYQGPALVGASPGTVKDGFLADGHVLGRGDEVFVTGQVMRRGKAVESLLLRSRPVRRELDLR